MTELEFRIRVLETFFELLEDPSDLMINAIGQGVNILRYCDPESEEYSEARAWLDNESAEDPSSFEYICNSLGYDSHFLRVGINDRLDAA